MLSAIPPARPEQLLPPLLASLPTAAVSSQPPTALLPLLSPILRQRVQLLSAANPEPWLPLLCYDSTKASKLEQVVKNDRLEPHPVSGEVEVDWEGEVELRYKRVDEETLQALASLRDLGFSVRLVWCAGDELGGGDGWRIGEVGLFDSGNSAWGGSGVAEAEATFKSNRVGTAGYLSADHATASKSVQTTVVEDDDDDDYWALYDNTPARTPAPKQSPAPQALQNGGGAHADEDLYYAQYASVQPAMDNHDPDEAKQNGDVESSLGKDEIARELQQNLTTPRHDEVSDAAFAWSQNSTPPNHMDNVEGLAQPRPGSSTGSSGSDMVDKLERRAAESAAREQSEVGIKQHIGTTVKSLYRLAKVSGIDREEFERLVRTELDCLALMDEDEC